GGVQDEVVQRRVGGIPAVEPLDGTGSGGVGGLEAAPGGGQIGVLPGRAPGGSALDGAVETDVEGGRVATEDQGGGPAQDDGTALVEQLPQGGVVGGSEAVGQIFDIPGHGDVPRRPEQRQSFQHRRPGLLVAFLGADAFLDRRRCHRRGVEQPVDEGQPEAVGQKAGDDGPAGAVGGGDGDEPCLAAAPGGVLRCHASPPTAVAGTSIPGRGSRYSGRVNSASSIASPPGALGIRIDTSPPRAMMLTAKMSATRVPVTRPCSTAWRTMAAWAGGSDRAGM